MSQVMSRFILALLVLSLTACGFHLRGYASMPESIKTLYVQGVDLKQDFFGLELKRALTRNGITVLDSYQQGAAILTILENSHNRNILSVGSNAKVSEYELESVVRFKVSDDKGQAIGTEQRVESRRDYQFDSNQVVAMDEQERVVREDLNKQLVQAVLRRLSAMK